MTLKRSIELEQQSHFTCTVFINHYICTAASHSKSHRNALELSIN